MKPAHAASITGQPAAAGNGPRLGTLAAIGLTAALAAAIGTATAGGLWICTDALRRHVEETGAQGALTAATHVSALAEPSAANINRMLDVVLDSHLEAQAEAAAMLVEAAETGGRSAAYIEDTLRQISARSPIRRIDVSGGGVPGYSTAAEAAPLEPALAALADGLGPGHAAMGATQAGGLLAKAAGSRLPHRAGIVRIEQHIDAAEPAPGYGGAGDRSAQTLAGRQAAATAQLIAHAVELAEASSWPRARIQERLAGITRRTAVRLIAAGGAGERQDYQAGRSADERHAARRGEAVSELRAQGQGALELGGYLDAQRRWVAVAAATRGPGLGTVLVEEVTRAGDGSLAESGWQQQAERLAAIDGITGVWVALTGGEAPRLAAAAPAAGGPGGEGAWRRWNAGHEQAAQRVGRSGRAESRAAIGLLGHPAASVLSAAPAGRTAAGQTVAVVVESRADEAVARLRRAAGQGLLAAALLIAGLATAASWTARRWLTRPIEAIAEAAGSLEAGERPDAALTAGQRGRRDEVGSLARSFEAMTERVLARGAELERAVAERTAELHESNDELRSARERMEQEIGLAQRVQRSLVPGGTSRHGRVRVSSRSTPANELGGDLVSTETGPDGRLVAAICDVSGKGVGSALLMAVAQAALSAAVRRTSDVAEIAAELNRRLCAGNELGMFATAWLASIDPRSGAIEHVNAGHEAPLRIGPTGAVTRIATEPGVPLGLDESARYRKLGDTLAGGETLVGYTDGVTDAANGGEENYGEERLQRLLGSSHPRGPEELIEHLWTNIDSFTGRRAATDDRTCLVLRLDEW